MDVKFGERILGVRGVERSRSQGVGEIKGIGGWRGVRGDHGVDGDD